MGTNSKIYFPNGDIFEGEVKDNEPHVGIMKYKKNYEGLFIKFDGGFKNAIPDGFGKFYFKEDMWVQGFIRNGLPYGKVVFSNKGKETKCDYSDLI